MNLLDIQQQQQQEPLSPKGINEIEMLEKQERSISSNKNKKQDSLAFQLDCLETQELTTTTGALSISEIVSVSPSNKKTKKVVKDVAMLAFPNLPSAISDSSCESSNTTHTGATTTATGLTRESGVPHGPSSEIAASSRGGSSKESFGWFVDLDEQEETKSSSGEDFVHSSSLTVTTNNKNASTEDLAFQAPTAPKRSTNHDEEMEQAYAADTIDSVLGDLF